MGELLERMQRAHVDRHARFFGVSRRRFPLLRVVPPTVPEQPESRVLNQPIQCNSKLRGRFIVKQIIRHVSTFYGCRPEELAGPVRTKEITRPRFIAIYLARRVTAQSMPWIGRQFGNRDHTTVRNALIRAHARLLSDFQFGSEAAALECVTRRAAP